MQTVDEHYISPLRKDLVKLTKHARQGLPIGDVQLSIVEAGRALAACERAPALQPSWTAKAL